MKRLLIFIPTVYATIDIFITGSFHTNFTSKTSGTDKAIITDEERASFNITDAAIKDCVRKYIGGRPDDAFIHGPTPWGNLYKKYGWTETYRVLKPISSRVSTVTSSPEMLKQEYVQNKTVIEISQTIFNRFSTNWVTMHDLSVDIINFHLAVDNFEISYSSEVGVDEIQLEAMKTGITLTESLDFASVVELYATRVLVKSEVLYRASLWGNAIVNFDRAFRGHHFYSPNLEDLMYICGLPNSLELKEVIDVGFYTDAKVVVKNKNTGMMVLTKNVQIHS